MQTEAPRNLLLIVIDQFRADLLRGPLADCVSLPNLRALSARAVTYHDHHTVTVPCGPARASLLTGQYAMSHRSVHNGTPLPRDMPNLASQLRTIGRELLLFGYTDTQPDPRGLHPRDPAHISYTGPIPGISEVTEMREEAWEWLAHLRAQGYDVPDAGSPEFDELYKPQGGVLGAPALYRAEDSDTAYLTDRVLAHLDVRKAHPWSAMVTYIRPHPPFVAPAPYHQMVDPAQMPAPTRPGFEHPFLNAYHSAPSGAGLFWGFDGRHETLSQEQIALCRATYLGLAAEVDHHVGRIMDWLDATGQAEDTLIVLTADHGEMLGDLGLWGKLTPFRTASHIPLMIAHPGGQAADVTEATGSIDVAPTILAALGAEIPAQMQGRDLSAPDATDGQPTMVELELGSETGTGRFEQSWSLPPEACRAVAFEQDGLRLVHFASGHASMLFDVQTDPLCTSDLAGARPDDVVRLTSNLLSFRMQALGPRC